MKIVSEVINKRVKKVFQKYLEDPQYTWSNFIKDLEKYKYNFPITIRVERSGFRSSPLIYKLSVINDGKIHIQILDF